jgi:hypothetical protein
MGGGSYPLKLPSAVTSQLNSCAVMKRGFVSEDCLISVLFAGSRLEVLNPQTGDRLAAWSFAPYSTPNCHPKSAQGCQQASEITCCVDMFNSETRASSERSLDGRFLCVGLSDGRVCIFDIFSSRVIRCLSLASRITALVCMTSPTSVPRSLCEELLLFSGLVAVGTQEGNLFLVDFSLDEESLGNVDESCPSQPFFTSLSGGTQKIAYQRTNASQRGQHLCVPLHELSQTKSNLKRPNLFTFNDNDHEPVHFPKSGVVVSSLSFVPQIGGLLVGYNFGAWQFWNISAAASGGKGAPATLDYSSPYSSEALPVTGFCFQEPENDPRNFVYVWVLRGENDLDSQEEKEAVSSHASISLNAMAFGTKDENDSGLVLYSGLASCQRRFHHTLGENSGSLCICGATLSLSAPGHGISGIVKKDLSELEDGQSNLGLCVFLWEAVRPSHDGRFFMGIFDLNAWYQAQMPSDVLLEPTSQCSYFSVCSLDESLGEPDSSLLHCRVDLNSVSRYKSTFNVEQHFFPSSLAFNLVCLLDFGLVHAVHLGLQRKVLLELRSTGKDSLVEPSRLHSVCVIAGLVNNDEELEVSLQRSSLLTTALEHHLVDFLRSCLHHWSDGNS